MNFLIGAISGATATTCIQPIDFVKVQLQIRSEAGERNLRPFKVIKEIIQKTGTIKTFYRGIDAAILRQFTYCSIRFGLFFQIKDMIITHKKRQPTIIENSIASLVAGGIGAFCGNPADLSLVRLQSDYNLPPQSRRNYKNAFDAIARTVKEEGLFVLWRGSTPTVIRSMSMAFGVLVSFELAKSLLSPYIDKPNLKTFLASLIGGFFGSVCSLPFDNLKTKLQKMKADSNGIMPYNGIFDCLRKTAKYEGIIRLWVGLGTFYVRNAPHAMISLVMNDLLRRVLINKQS